MKKIVVILIAAVCVLYGVSYAYAYKNAPKPRVEYYGEGETVEYNGVEYVLKGAIYTEDELLREFGLNKDELGKTGMPYKYKYIVVDLKMKRVKEQKDDKAAQGMGCIVSRYWQTGMEPGIQQLIQKENYKSAEELKIGDETSGYQVFSINDANHCSRIWDEADDATVYYELQDYEGSEYLRWIRILN